MDINQALNEIPAQIARVGQEAEDLRLEWQMGKETYDSVEAKMALLIKAGDPKKTATEIKYMVLDNTELYTKRLELLVKEGEYRKKLKEMEALEHELNSAKVLSRIKVAEMTSLEFGLKKEEKDV